MNNETPEIITPLGIALHNARLAASLSIDEVAERLNLGGGAVKDLEGDISVLIDSDKYSSIYLRGYLVNYAKLVGLNAICDYVEYQRLAKSQKPENAFRATASTAPVKKKKLISLPFVMMLIFIAVVVVIVNQLGLLSTDKSASIDTEQIAENDVNEENKPFNPLVVSSNAVVEPESRSSAQVAEKIQIAEQANQAETTSQTSSAQTPSITVTDAPTEVSNELIKIDTPTEVSNEQIQTNITAEVSNEPIQTDTAAVIDASEPTPEKNVTNDSLTLSFAKDCWTEIVDATGKRLAFDLYKKGAVLSIEGVSPFKLKLGVPSAVAINYQGKTLETFTAVDTAEFYIPQ